MYKLQGQQYVITDFNLHIYISTSPFYNQLKSQVNIQITSAVSSSHGQKARKKFTSLLIQNLEVLNL